MEMPSFAVKTPAAAPFGTGLRVIPTNSASCDAIPEPSVHPQKKVLTYLHGGAQAPLETEATRNKSKLAGRKAAMILRLASEVGTILACPRRTAMRRLDLTPLYKSSIGFDHLASVLDQLSNLDAENGFPPYNIERLAENNYRISMAVAGFGDNDLSIDVKEGTLTIRGEKKGDDKSRQYIHQGIAARNFERRFRLAEYVEVSSA